MDPQHLDVWGKATLSINRAYFVAAAGGKSSTDQVPVYAYFQNSAWTGNMLPGISIYLDATAGQFYLIDVTMKSSGARVMTVTTPNGPQTQSVVDGDNHVSIMFEAAATGNFIFDMTGDNNWSFYSAEVTTLQ